ncbi:uncharacterized protein [Dermacentor andersoni]|uniref:uncharacterized protein n=1 Tax=Dermacentor andersoni TaxID=34620 RepID=UPI002416DEF6|nr:uncharacterized protein LOC129380455 [Dermacentor andersoni]XP_054917409.1 uncharacterized protein LOC129380455 [Dermacentor andersoni]
MELNYHRLTHVRVTGHVSLHIYTVQRKAHVALKITSPLVETSQLAISSSLTQKTKDFVIFKKLVVSKSMWLADWLQVSCPLYNMGHWICATGQQKKNIYRGLTKTWTLQWSISQ